MARAPRPVDPGSDEAAEIKRDFDRNVNMSAAALRKWLESDESKAVGQSDSGGEAVGHASGRRIVSILEKRKGDLDAEDYAHMKKVNGYVERHLAQRPDKSSKELRERLTLASCNSPNASRNRAGATSRCACPIASRIPSTIA